MTKTLMQKTTHAILSRPNHGALISRNPHSLIPPAIHPTFFSPCRNLAQVQSARDTPLFNISFTSSIPPLRSPKECGLRPDNPPPDERTLKLGKTLRILQSRLPTLLASPLPPETLSPHITLHLFPSTHPHLPTVSGRVAYHAALWTAPVAWGRVPIVGNIKLIILNERITKTTSPYSGSRPNGSSGGDEKLIVRWKTCGKTHGKGMGALYRGISASEQVDKITEWLGGDARDDEEFCGLFIFEFDEEGRVVTHTIEHAEEGGSWDKASRVVSVTDWLLGRARATARGTKREETIPGLAWGCCGEEERKGVKREEVNERMAEWWQSGRRK